MLSSIIIVKMLTRGTQCQQGGHESLCLSDLLVVLYQPPECLVLQGCVCALTHRLKPIIIYMFQWFDYIFVCTLCAYCPLRPEEGKVGEVSSGTGVVDRKHPVCAGTRNQVFSKSKC